MQRALDTHDTVLRALLARYFGYEVTTEGDSFTMAFHDPVDAVSACYLCCVMQQGATASLHCTVLLCHRMQGTC